MQLISQSQGMHRASWSKSFSRSVARMSEKNPVGDTGGIFLTGDVWKRESEHFPVRHRRGGITEHIDLSTAAAQGQILGAASGAVREVAATGGATGESGATSTVAARSVASLFHVEDSYAGFGAVAKAQSPFVETQREYEPLAGRRANTVTRWISKPQSVQTIEKHGIREARVVARGRCSTGFASGFLRVQPPASIFPDWREMFLTLVR